MPEIFARPDRAFEAVCGQLNPAVFGTDETQSATHEFLRTLNAQPDLPARLDYCFAVGSTTDRRDVADVADHTFFTLVDELPTDAEKFSAIKSKAYKAEAHTPLCSHVRRRFFSEIEKQDTGMRIALYKEASQFPATAESAFECLLIEAKNEGLNAKEQQAIYSFVDASLRGTDDGFAKRNIAVIAKHRLASLDAA